MPARFWNQRKEVSQASMEDLLPWICWHKAIRTTEQTADNQAAQPQKWFATVFVP